MLDKRALTKKFLKELGWETHSKSINKHHYVWWMNPRNMGDSKSFRLTDKGFVMLSEKLSVKSYKIVLPPGVEWTSGLIIKLDKLIDAPYYLDETGKNILVFKEKTAVELILYEGDIQKYLLAKQKLRENNTTDIS